MPRIPIYESQVPLLQTGPSYLMGVAQEAARGPAMIGDALGGLAKGVANTADMLQDYADKDEVRKAAADLSSFQIDQAQRTADRQQNADPASSTYVDESLNDYDSRARTLINKYARNRKAQEYLDQRLSGHRTEVGTNAIGTHAAATAKAQRTQAATTITNLTKQVGADPTRLDAAFQEVDTVIDTLPGGQAEREAARFGARRLIAQSYWKGLIERDPGASLQQLKTGKFIGNEYFNDADRAGLILQANDGLKRRELETSRTRYAQQAAAQQQKIKDATSGEFPPQHFKTALDTDFAGDALMQDFARLMQNSTAQRQARQLDELKSNIQSGIFNRADIDAQIARGDWPKILAPELTQLADRVWARQQDDTAADIRFQDILKNRTPFDPADRALGPAIQRYVTGEFQPSVLPQLRSTDPDAQSTSFAKVAAFYTEMTPFQRAQVRFDAIPAIAPSDAARDAPTPANAATTEPALPDATTAPPPAPSRTAFTLEKILPKPVAHAMATALDALDPAVKAQQLCKLYKDVGAENWSKFCTELRATGRISDTTTTMAVAATQPDAEHTTPGLAAAITALSTHGTTSSASVDPAAVKAARDQVQQSILRFADKFGVKEAVSSLIQIGGRLADMFVRGGDSPETAGARAARLIAGDAAEQESVVPTGGGGEPPGADDRGDADTPKLQPVIGEPLDGNPLPDAQKPTPDNAVPDPADRKQRLVERLGQDKADFVDTTTRRILAMRGKSAEEKRKLYDELIREKDQLLPIPKWTSVSNEMRIRQQRQLYETGISNLFAKLDDPKHTDADEANYLTFREALFPDNPITPSERLYPKVRNWVAPAQGWTDSPHNYLRMTDALISQPPSSRQAMIGLIVRLDRVSRMDDRALAAYLAEARNVIRPEEFGEFQEAIGAIRNGQSYAVYIDKLTDRYVQVDNFAEFAGLVVDFIPIIGSTKAGFELHEKLGPLLELHKKQKRDTEEQKEYDKRLTEFIIDAGFLVVPAAARAGRTLRDTKLGQAVRERILKQLDEYATGSSSPPAMNAVPTGKPPGNAVPPVQPIPQVTRPHQDYGKVLTDKLAFPKILNDELTNIPDADVSLHVEKIVTGSTFISGKKSLPNVEKIGGVAAARADFDTFKNLPVADVKISPNKGLEVVNLPGGTTVTLFERTKGTHEVTIYVRSASTKDHHVKIRYRN